MNRPANLGLPLALIVIGVLVLLNNLGILTWHQLGVAVVLWPLLVVLVGVRLVASALFSPVVASVVSWVAVLAAAGGAVGFVLGWPDLA